MKISCDSMDINKGLRLVGDVVREDTVTPILRAVKLETAEDELLLTATDLETWLQCRIPVEVAHPGKTVLPKERFLRILENWGPG